MEVTPELVLDRVRAAGGRLKLEGLDKESLAAWRHAAKVAKLRLLRAGPQRLRTWSSPGGMSLLLVEVDRQGVESSPLAPPDQPTREWAPPPRPRPRTQELLGRIVPVPSTVRRPHQLVQDLTDALDYPERMIYQHRPYLMPNKRRPVQRMRQIWQAIITEAEFRGYETLFRHNRRDHYDSGQLILRIDWEPFPFLRRGEAAGLRWSEVDLHAGQLTVSRQRTTACYQVHEGPPKSATSRRAVALDHHTVRVLRQHHDRQRHHHDTRTTAGRLWHNTGYVFTSPDGTPIHPGYLTQRLRLLVDRAGLPPIRLHDLRHGAATLARTAGADLKLVQDQLDSATPPSC
ncbi:site-specific integrase [Micromonospora sp. 4G57]|uniref:Site-specific integrase n=1 Tax=Micromonospora sicca TaxID=2202420 RepID=A0ABU5JN44_9ACTN|nr:MULTISPECIES: site-specific integrase [unclassified Micromonospora]MDZ5447388.1 site-specific integrase [Micromonospora sp. 4G57]MDZ5494047.1 site-specific integrase [Micromonospora sp. 4G53]